MPSFDLNEIMKLKKIAMKRCEERILESASQNPDGRTNIEENPECYGISQILKKRHGL
ncbi:MAG: hypothetical protein V1862_06445 [Methanobacteriota archaeon]